MCLPMGQVATILFLADFEGESFAPMGTYHVEYGTNTTNNSNNK